MPAGVSLLIQTSDRPNGAHHGLENTCNFRLGGDSLAPDNGYDEGLLARSWKVSQIFTEAENILLHEIFLIIRWE